MYNERMRGELADWWDPASIYSSWFSEVLFFFFFFFFLLNE